MARKARKDISVKIQSKESVLRHSFTREDIVEKSQRKHKKDEARRREADHVPAAYRGSMGISRELLHLHSENSWTSVDERESASPILSAPILINDIR